MPHKLKDLLVTEVSLVDKPANPGARVMLFKRAEPKLPLKERLTAWFQKAFGNTEAPKTFDSCMMAAKLDDFWWRTHDALRSSVRSIIDSDAPNKAELVKQSLNQYLETVMNALDLTEPDPLQLHKGIDQLQEQVAELDAISLALDEDIEKAGKMISDANMKRLTAAMDAIRGILEAAGPKKPEEAAKTLKRGGTMDLKEILKSLPDDQRGQVETELAKVAELEQEVAKVAELEQKVAELTKGQGPDPEDIWKGINPEIRKQFAAMEKRAEEAEKLAKAEKEAREHAELMKRAEAYNQVGSSEEVAKMLKQAYGVSDEYGKQLEATLKAAQERIEKGALFNEVGKDGQGGNNAVAKLEAAAAEIRKAEPTLTKEQAFAKALENNPDLYIEYQQGE